VSEHRLAELHIVRAREEALYIFAFTGAVYPVEWKHSYTETIVSRLFDFAFHARRVTQLCSLRDVDFGSIRALPVKISEGDPGNWEDNYHFALNRLAHAAEFTLGSAHADHRKLFLASEANLMPIYAKIRTDQHEEASISLFGLAFCFLTRVIPEIKVRFPDYRF
jgi:hypothetical protein